MLKPLILVDAHDRPKGLMSKIEAHKLGLTHRAFSVFLLRQYHGHWQTLLQQRHYCKYHSAGLWSNACCSHPGYSEDLTQSAQNRLAFELGVSVPLTPIGKFHYRAETPPFIEDELDHVFIGYYDQASAPYHRSEVMNTQWINIDTLCHQLSLRPQHFTPWLKAALEQVILALKRPH